MKEHASFWLVPAEPEKVRLSKMISELAKRFAAPEFEPHVTIYSGPLGEGENLGGIVREATCGVSPITLLTTGLRHTPEFTRTLFVEFAPNEPLMKLNRALKQRVMCPCDYELRPHLSLLYAPIAEEAKEALAREFSVSAQIQFDTIKVILSSGSTRVREDVEAWRLVAAAKLGKSE